MTEYVRTHYNFTSMCQIYGNKAYSIFMCFNNFSLYVKNILMAFFLWQGILYVCVCVPVSAVDVCIVCVHVCVGLGCISVLSLIHFM